MKSLLLLLTAALFPLIALGQAPSASPAPVPSAGNTHDAAATVPLPGQPTGPNLEKNLPLIPETVPPNPASAGPGKPAPAASPQQAATFQTEDDIRVRLRMRAAETRALNDPAIQADWAAAHNTRTDPERRTLLTVYYNDLYNRMLKLDPASAQRIEARRLSTLARMKYNRLGDEDNSENPFVPPAPVPSGPNPPASDSGQ